MADRDASIYDVLVFKLAFSANAFKKNTLAEAIDAIADIGYAGVELMADAPHIVPLEALSAEVETITDQLSARNLVVSNVNAFTGFFDGDTYHPTWIEDDPERVTVRVNHTLSCVRLAAAVSARTVSLQPGGPLIGTSLSRHDAGTRFADGIARVLPTARELGITLAIEPEPGLLIQTSAEFHEFKQTFFADDPLVQMNCDVGHLFCVGEDPAEVIRRYAHNIAHVHLEDIGGNRVHQHLTPGRGAIDFRSIFLALREIRYHGWATVELYPYETTAAGVAGRAFAHLDPILRSI
ncbi:MAG TPA: sugar phosphate isomerase/epimerase [Tepidisphaeraceae bacterium]|nr:sugar phosphate isomerase/epimerase [Tepidisphaeraceae bacterium]